MAQSWGAHLRATLVLGIPMVGAQIAQLGINTTDVIIIGQLGAVPLAAIVLAAQFFFNIFIFGAGLAVAVVPMVAQAYGRGDTVSTRRSVRMGMWAAICYAVFATPLFLNAESIWLAMGQKAEVAALAAQYVHVSQFGLLPALLFAVLRAFVGGIGRAGVILYVTVATLVLNAVLAYGLVLGHYGLPALGMFGASMVAVMVQWCSFFFLVGYIQSRPGTRAYELFVRFWRPDWPAFGEVVRLGLPVGITMLAEVSLFAAGSLLMGRISTLQLAAHGIAIQLASLVFMIPLGLSQAATVRVGIAHGQGDHGNLVRAAITVVVISSVCSVLGTILFLLYPYQLGSLFIDNGAPNAPEVLRLAVPLILVAGIFQWVDGVQAVVAGLLRGLKDARMPMVIALISYWPIGFMLAWVLAFPLGFGGVGVWLGFLLGLFSAAVMLSIRFVLKVAHERRLLPA
nr:MATE family efflux transporter [Rhizobium halophytocola]